MTDLPSRIAHLLDELTKWRETEHAAQLDIDDTEAHLIACDLKHQEAKPAHQCVVAKVTAVENELASAIIDHTSPVEIVFLEGE